MVLEIVTLANRVRTLREGLEPRMSQVELSRRIGAEDSYMGAVEAGRIRLPSRDLLAALGRELRTTVADLLNAAGYLPDSELAELSAQLGDPRFVLAMRRVAGLSDERVRDAIMDVARRLADIEDA
jgi:transcriptional regulator with XRE-family HTH domain